VSPRPKEASVRAPERAPKSFYPELPRWLEEHGESLEAGRVFESWLAAGGGRGMIRSFLTPWLERHGASLEAGPVLRFWLLAKGERELIQPFVAPWLQTHGGERAAGLVFTAWLSAKGDRHVVGPFVRPWLEAHGESPEAQFLLSSWLSSGGNSRRLRPFVVKWLSLHCEDRGASYVLKAWLEAEGDSAAVRPFVASWLAKHGAARDATFVVRPWLEAEGDFELVREAALRWFAIHHESFEASFLASALGRQKDLPAETVREILAWCGRYAGHQQALWVMTSLGSHLFQPALSGEAAGISGLVIGLALAEAETALTTKLLVLRLFSILARDSQLRSETSFLFLNGLAGSDLYQYDPSSLSPANLRLHERSQNPSIVLYVKELIDTGLLSVARDGALLRRFFSWIGTWEANPRNRARRLLAELTGGAGKVPGPNDDPYSTDFLDEP
jgi:hypothetical protein